MRESFRLPDGAASSSAWSQWLRGCRRARRCGRLSAEPYRLCRVQRPSILLCGLCLHTVHHKCHHSAEASIFQRIPPSLCWHNRLPFPVYPWCRFRLHHRIQVCWFSSPVPLPPGTGGFPIPARYSYGKEYPEDSARYPEDGRSAGRAYPLQAVHGKQHPCYRDGPPSCHQRRFYVSVQYKHEPAGLRRDLHHRRFLLWIPLRLQWYLFRREVHAGRYLLPLSPFRRRWHAAVFPLRSALFPPSVLPYQPEYHWGVPQHRCG